MFVAKTVLWRHSELGAPLCCALFCTALSSLSVTRVWADRDKLWPPAPSFTILQEEIPLGDDPLGEDYDRHMEYALQLENQEETIFLARAFHRESPIERVLGFAIESFKLATLSPDLLLHASWSTTHLAGGANICESDLLLAKANGKWVEVFRDTHDGQYKAGLSHTSYWSFRFSFDAPSRALIVEKNFTQSDYWEGEPNLFARQVAIGIEEDNKDAPVYGSSYTLVEEWLCTLGEGELKWGAGSRYLTLHSGPFRLADVITFLRTQISIDGIGAMNEKELSTRIRTLNPHFGTSDICWGNVRFDIDLPRYVENHGHRYRMSTE